MNKVTKEIEFTAEAHDGMERKKDKTPYIIHSLQQKWYYSRIAELTSPFFNYLRKG